MRRQIRINHDFFIPIKALKIHLNDLSVALRLTCLNLFFPMVFFVSFELLIRRNRLSNETWGERTTLKLKQKR